MIEYPATTMSTEAGAAGPSGSRPKLSVTVRGARRDDAQALYECRSCPGVIRGTLQLPFRSADESAEWLSQSRPNVHRLVAEVEGRVVGTLTLNVRDGRQAHVGHIGMMVHDDFQGRGVGSALMAAAIELAEKWLGLHRIDLEVYTDNESALALYRKFGFEIEGTKRRIARRDGAWVDTYVMARLAPLPSADSPTGGPHA